MNKKPLIYHYRRFGAPGTARVESLDEAEQRAAHDIEWNMAAPVRVTDDRENVLLEWTFKNGQYHLSRQSADPEPWDAEEVILQQKP